MRAFNHVEQLVQYGLNHHMLELTDVPYVRNLIWQYLNIETDLSLLKDVPTYEGDIYALLNDMTEDAREIGRTLEYVYEIESFQAELMGKLLPRPSEFNRQFNALYQKSAEAATTFFYEISNASTYIRMDRVSKNVTWKSESDYGELDITINLSKPEKDPKEIALQKNVKATQYPKCLLCVENVGYQGNINHPARQNHRIVKLELDGEPWYFQYSPYVYYNEHAIVLCQAHRDMKIDHHTFVRLCDFVDKFSHYFIGSNADLHTVGGSILSHDHYQAGNYEMPMMKANVHETYRPVQFPDVEIDILDWPLSVLRVTSKNREALINVSDKILDAWIPYSDEVVELIANTNERHNTITPILRQKDGVYEMYLALRNNRKTELHPAGLFHPHAEHHHIKRENIGLIEVMGLAVLPSRLVDEMKAIEACCSVEKGLDLEACGNVESLVKHLAWLEQIKPEIDQSPEQIENILKHSIGIKFAKVLEDAGIYKDNWQRMRLFLEQL